MYYLMMWDTGLAAVGRDGCLDRIEIPLDVASFFFRLDVEQFPMLSSLSFDDYDLFFGTQISALADELVAVANINPSMSELVKQMLGLLFKAQSLSKAVLFDPFK
ncbi:hypothetical protein N2A98_13485 [Pseudomonas sp. FJ2-5-13]|uniref:hypothetical protein n=1 Tax=Pseudomonas sp. FJ2-5-13 TaxID=2976884 RepID=UPI0023D86006|nr:hypothetical protein [Pseudomonas sp. FJ2-5-13]WEJ03178.1 hypothetical protein N2A98_13485 [Pseudomonas sp. FJ2-5-13]